MVDAPAAFVGVTAPLPPSLAPPGEDPPATLGMVVEGDVEDEEGGVRVTSLMDEMDSLRASRERFSRLEPAGDVADKEDGPLGRLVVERAGRLPSSVGEVGRPSS